MARSVQSGDAFRELSREKERGDAYGNWVRSRADTLVSSVTAHDVLRHFNTPLKLSDDQEEQISCPFHGQDRKPSARVYPPGGSSRSGVYCWVCQKRWDIFGLWKMFHGDDQMKFTEVVRGLEKAFGIIPPDMPSVAEYETIERGPSEREQRVLNLLEVCERRIAQAKPYFTLKGFMTVGKLLDQMHYHMRHKSCELSEIEKRAQLVLDKIGEKIRGV